MSRLSCHKYLELRRAIRAKGFSQQDVCDMWNETHTSILHQPVLSLLLSGKRQMTLEHIWFFIKVLDISPTDFAIMFPDEEASA